MLRLLTSLCLVLPLCLSPGYADPPAAVVTPGIKTLNENLVQTALPAPPSNSWPLHEGKAIVIVQSPDHVWNVVQPTLSDSKKVFQLVSTSVMPAKSPIFAVLEGNKVGKQLVYAQDTIVLYHTGEWPDDKTDAADAARGSLLVVIQKLKVDKFTATLVDQQVVEVFAPAGRAKPPVTPVTPVTPGGPVNPNTPLVTPTKPTADPELVKSFSAALAQDMAATSNGTPLGSKADVMKLAQVYGSTAAWIGGSADKTAPKPTTWKEVIDDLTAASVAGAVPRLPSLMNLRAAISKIIPDRPQETPMTAELTATTLAQFKAVSLALMEISK